MRRGVANDAAWVLAGQIGAALAMVVGIRLLTEFVSPETFGTISLVLGAVALTTNMVCAPITQSALHFYPELESRGAIAELRRSLLRCMRKPALWAAAIYSLAAVACVVTGSSLIFVIPLAALLVVCDSAKAFETTFLNAAREHKRYSLWMAGEAWLRPLIAVAVTLLARESAPLVLLSYAAASVLLWALFARRKSRVGNASPLEAEQRFKLDDRVWKYTLPMIPLGLIDWTNGVADRYVIGGLLSVADAGVYAAVYGLASRPFSILGQSIELVVRPIYQKAVSASQTEKADRLVWQWFACVVALGALGVSFVTLFRYEIAQLTLGIAFQRGADLLPWIAGGYALLSIAQVFQRVCFAHGDSRAVLWIQTSAAVVGVVATIVGAERWGLVGAAVAVPVCFATQLGASMFCANRSRQRHGGMIVRENFV